MSISTVCAEPCQPSKPDFVQPTEEELHRIAPMAEPVNVCSVQPSSVPVITEVPQPTDILQVNPVASNVPIIMPATIPLSKEQLYLN
jgi:hypothetical protein